MGIKVGDAVAVVGVGSGTSVKASLIVAGVQQMRGGTRRIAEDTRGGTQSIASNFSGNREPVIAGILTSKNGNSFVITTRSGIVYTIDVTSAKIMLTGNSAGTITDLQNGDSLVVEGTVGGSAVVATTVFDEKSLQPSSSSTIPLHAERENISSRVGGFFKKLFGF